jgi:NhaP-type Na+/H+ or K+/H+ antiporter
VGGFVAVGLVGVLYAVAAGRLERWSIGGPLVFTLAGIALGPAGFGAIDTPATNEVVELVTELTLALLLFADASTLGLVQLRRHAGIPARLLLIGLPLTIVLGGGLAYLTLPGITMALAFLVATILAPTDAALSLAVVSNPRVPMTVRNSLNVESGLNDGIATPIVTVLIAVVAAEEGATQGWLAYAVKTIAVALAVAAVLGGGAGWLVLRARQAGWTSPISEQFIVLTVALLSYLGTVSLGGNGFVASFVGGLVFGLVSRRELSVATEYAETTGLFLSYAVWALFGGVLAGPLLEHGWHASALVYAVLSLTVVRAVPVALSLIGAGLDRTTVLFVGWFGPRGLASIVFLILAVHGLHLDLAQIVGEGPYEAVVWTILLSVVLHGITAGPLASAYGKRANELVRPDPDAVGTDSELRRRRFGLGSTSEPS